MRFCSLRFTVVRFSSGRFIVIRFSFTEVYCNKV